MEDQDLLRLMRKNSGKGWEILVNQYSGLLYHIVRGRISGNREDIEEITADAFAEAFQKWSVYDADRGSIKAFLATITVRRAIDWVRRHKNEMVLDETIVAQDGELLVDGIIRREDRRKVMEVLSEIDEPDRSMVIERFFFRRSSKEMALSYNLTPNAVDKRISRAVAAMRPKMEVDLDES